MTGWLALYAIAAAANPPPVSTEECDVLRAAVVSELAAEKHFAMTLRLTAAPTEWMLWGNMSVGDKNEPGPLPAKGLAPASLSGCQLAKLFRHTWRVSATGAKNLQLADDEPLLNDVHEAREKGMWSVMLSRATIDEPAGRATVLFGGGCGATDLLSVARQPDGSWVASAPRSLGDLVCETFVEPHVRRTLSPATACAVALHPRRYANRTLVLSGAYGWNWEWGAFLKFEGCKAPLRTPQNALVRESLSSAAIPQGSARVVFEGRIVPGQTCSWQGKPVPASRCDYFEVTRIETFELEP